MRNFSKALLSTVLIIVIVAALSLGTIEGLMRSEYYHCSDNKNRLSLAEKIDFLIIGASEGMNGFNPQIIDEDLKCTSYNLCGPATTIFARYFLLEQELSKSPIDTVVYSIASNTFMKDPISAESNMYTIPRLYNFGDRLSFFFRNSSVKGFDELLGAYMKDGFYVLNSKLIGKNSMLGTDPKSNVDYSAKGFRRNESNDITLSDEEILSTYNTIIWNNDNKVFDEYLKKAIALCKEKNVRFIITIPPFSDLSVWQRANLDDFNVYLNEISSQYGVEYYNFALMKEKSTFFSDSSAFSDDTHLSGDGADKFSHLFCDILKKVDAGEDVSDLFYSSYEEMKEDSPYMEYYKAHCND